MLPPRLGRQGLFGLARERGETLRVAHRDVGQNLAVQLHAGSLQTMHELAVGKLVEPGGRTNADDPQAAKVAFAGSAVAVAEPQRALHRLFGGAVQLALGQHVTLGALQNLAAAGNALGSSFYSRHGIFSLKFARGPVTNRAACAAR